MTHKFFKENWFVLIGLFFTLIAILILGQQSIGQVTDSVVSATTSPDDTINTVIEEHIASVAIQFGFIHYVLAFLAYILNVTQKLYNAKRKGEKLVVGYYWQRNWYDHVLAVGSIIVLFLLGNEILDALKLYGVPDNVITLLSNGTKILAFIFGWANYSIIKVITGLTKKKGKE